MSDDLPSDATLSVIGDGNVHRGRAIVLDLMARVREERDRKEREADDDG